MIVGISVSDIYGCARLAYVLYDELKQAQGACRDFARDLLLFHQVLLKTKLTIECETSRLSDSDEAALMICLDSCKELLYADFGCSHEAFILGKETLHCTFVSLPHPHHQRCDTVFGLVPDSIAYLALAIVSCLPSQPSSSTATPLIAAL